MNFWTSDPHHNHARICELTPRPFASVEEMGRVLIRNWNDRVGEDDTVHVVGDFAMGDRTLIPSVLAQLKGRIVLYAGNHDYRRDDHYFPRVFRGPQIVHLDGHTITVAHEPAHTHNGLTNLALCGHVHTAWREKRPGETVWAGRNGAKSFTTACRLINVGVDVWGFTPRTLEELLRGGPDGVPAHM